MKITTKNRKLPKYRKVLLRGFECARVEFNGCKFGLGRYGTAESMERYHRMVAEYIASGFSPLYGRPVDAPTVGQLIEAYLLDAFDYYGANKHGEYAILVRAIEPLKSLYASLPANEFGPLQLKAVRKKMVNGNCTRKYVNSRVQHIVRMFRWAVSEGLLTADIPAALAMVPALRRGRTEARENRKILPVATGTVERTLPFLTPVLKSMVEFQRLTGCRPGELVILRPGDVDRRADVWEYQPSKHKTQYLEKDRVIFIGPLAQTILRPYLLRPADAFCFSPQESSRQARERFDAARDPRLTPLYPSETRRVERKKRLAARRRKKRSPGDRYTTGSYTRAIRRACARAFGASARHWTPNQLRHSAATEIRKRYGLEAAQVLLGHSKADVTQIYAERNTELAVSVAKQIG